jgi:hypothetical protein
VRKGFKRALALAGALVLTMSVSVSSFAAGKPDIKLDGGEEGISKMIKKFEAPTSRNKATDDYKYQGYVSFLDLADKDYKYLTITYTGNISRFRIQGCHNAGMDDEKIDDTKYWFGEIDTTGSDKIVATVDGSNIPIVGDNTTIVIDLAKTGIDVGYYNSGLHMHCDMMATNGDFEITDAFLSADKEKAQEEAKKHQAENNAKEGTKSAKGNSSSVSKDSNSSDGNASNSSTTTSNNMSSAPTTGESTTPVMLGFAGIVVACAAFAVSRRFKEEN